MKVSGHELDHIEIYDETGRLLCCISDEECIGLANIRVEFCEDDVMFLGKNANEFYEDD